MINPTKFFEQHKSIINSIYIYALKLSMQININNAKDETPLAFGKKK